MNTGLESLSIPDTTTSTAHLWLKKIRLSYVPGPCTSMLEQFITALLGTFKKHGHSVMDKPQADLDVLLTTAAFGAPLNWREAAFFNARRKYKLESNPTVFTILHATPGRWDALLEHFQEALQKDVPNPKDFEFPGLSKRAFHTLYEQGRRGGPILAAVRLLQSQAMSIRIILVVGDEQPREAYTFDLVGAHPRSEATDPQAFYDDLALRIVTAASTQEITAHQVVGEPIPYPLWKASPVPAAMQYAGRQLGKRHFFTEMVRVANLVSVPAVHDAVSRQYSEGCFATWDPLLGGLVTTITGSARPVDKDKLTEAELAIIVGIRPDGLGALVRHVEGKQNDPPSSEAVELVDMDAPLPRIHLPADWGISAEVPVARSKLHGHRGVRSFDPRRVEHASLDPPYYHYPVSCSTEAQARAIRAAFSRSAALNDPADPRQVVFTVLPGHGVVIVEKWVAGKQPFQVIWEYLDAGYLEIENPVPQGRLTFTEAGNKMVLQEITQN